MIVDFTLSPLSTGTEENCKKKESNKDIHDKLKLQNSIFYKGQNKDEEK